MSWGSSTNFLQRPHQELPQVGAQIDDFTATVADFPLTCQRIANSSRLCPSGIFWNFIAEKGEERIRNFILRMQAEVTDLIEERGRIAGVRAKTPQGELEVRADLVLGAGWPAFHCASQGRT